VGLLILSFSDPSLGSILLAYYLLEELLYCYDCFYTYFLFHSSYFILNTKKIVVLTKKVSNIDIEKLYKILVIFPSIHFFSIVIKWLKYSLQSNSIKNKLFVCNIRNSLYLFTFRK
jgi:hypothetical protein